MKTKLYDILEDLWAESSTNKKKEILEQNKDNETWKKYLFYTYNMHYRFHKNSFHQDFDTDGDTSLQNKDTFIDDFFEALDKLRLREVTGNAADEMIDSLFAKWDWQTKYLFYYACVKDIDAGISVKTINSVYDNYIPSFSVMKASPAVIVDGQEYFAEEKHNGNRICIFYDKGKISMFTRNGNPTYVPAVANSLKEMAQTFSLSRFMHEIEIIVDWKLAGFKEEPESEKIRLKAQGILTKYQRETAKGYEDEALIAIGFHVMPLEHYEDKYSPLTPDESYKLLDELYETPALNFQKSERAKLKTKKDIVEYYLSLTARGREGVMLKTLDGLYDFSGNPSTAWMKLKNTAEVDLLVVGTYEGNKSRSETVGGLLCESSCSKVKVRVGGGLNEVQLKAIAENPPIGKLVKVRCNSITPVDDDGFYSLYLPRFNKDSNTLEEIIRDDKDVADDYQDIVNELKASIIGEGRINA